jgi:hypothetical protein
VKRRGLHARDRRILGPMTRLSDNDAADAVMGRVGTGGLDRLAGSGSAAAVGQAAALVGGTERGVYDTRLTAVAIAGAARFLLGGYNRIDPLWSNKKKSGKTKR